LTGGDQLYGRLMRRYARPSGTTAGARSVPAVPRGLYEQFVILREEYPTKRRGVVQQFRVVTVTGPVLEGRQHIDVPRPQPDRDRPRHMLVYVQCERHQRPSPARRAPPWEIWSCVEGAKPVETPVHDAGPRLRVASSRQRRTFPGVPDAWRVRGHGRIGGVGPLLEAIVAVPGEVRADRA